MINIGLIGLGSMGYNLARNLTSKDFKVCAYEKNITIIKKIEQDKVPSLFLVKSLKQLINDTPSQRIIMLSLPANKIDECIEDIIEFMNPGDTIGVREKSKSLQVITASLEANSSVYEWMVWNSETYEGKFVSIPQRVQIPENIKEQLIVELYSK